MHKLIKVLLSRSFVHRSAMPRPRSIQLFKNLIRNYGVYLFCIMGCSVSAHLKSDELRLDHVVIAVKDIEAAQTLFREYGFALKKGKRHDNGLVNSFIEFSDGTEIELMSVFRETTDTIASGYKKFLTHSEGGMFIALSGYDIHKASERLREIRVRHSVQAGSLWDYLTFPENSGLEHVFLFQSHKPLKNNPTTVRHRNGVVGINEIWLDSGHELVRMLNSLNMQPCDDNYYCEIDNAVLHLIEKRNHDVRPQIKGIKLVTAKEISKSNIDAYGIRIKLDRDIKE